VVVSGDRGAIDANGAGILCGPKGVSNALGLVTCQRANVMHWFMRGLSTSPDQSYDSVVFQLAAIACATYRCLEEHFASLPAYLDYL